MEQLATQLGALGPLVLSLAGVAGVTALLTEVWPLGASGNQKRGQAIVYALMLTLVLYSIGGVDVPLAVAPEFAGLWWWKFVVLAVAAGIAAIGAMGGASLVQATLRRAPPADGPSD